jgi:methionine synthase II (cobalamin-independent)
MEQPGMSQNLACPVHLVGSMSLKSQQQAMETAAAILGNRAKRLSDGELGKVKNWILGHHQVFESCPAFQSYDHIEQFDPRARDTKRRRFKLVSNAPLDRASLPPIGHADDAAAAFRILSGLKKQNKVATDVKLLVAMPTPYDVLNFAVDEKDYPRVAPVYEAHMLAELDAILRHVPHAELAIQWDVAHEFEFLATTSRMFHYITRDQIIDLLVRLGDSVPEGVDLGYHCCYGNFKLKHFVEPRDTGDIVDVMNAVLNKISRKIDFIHLPVPRLRSDTDYFGPLRALQLQSSTELYLGLVHDIDGVEGALARAAAAKTVIDRFGIATECGLSQRTPENIRQILKLEAEIAVKLDAWSANRPETPRDSDHLP